MMVFKANNCISPPISRAQVCAMAYPCELNTGVAGDLLKYGWKTRQIVDACSHSLCPPPPCIQSAACWVWQTCISSPPPPDHNTHPHTHNTHQLFAAQQTGQMVARLCARRHNWHCSSTALTAVVRQVQQRWALPPKIRGLRRPQMVVGRRLCGWRLNWRWPRCWQRSGKPARQQCLCHRKLQTLERLLTAQQTQTRRQQPHLSWVPCHCTGPARAWPRALMANWMTTRQLQARLCCCCERHNCGRWTAAAKLLPSECSEGATTGTMPQTVARRPVSHTQTASS